MMTYKEWQEFNTNYLLIGNNNEITGQINFPSSVPLNVRENIMMQMASLLHLKWSEATDYKSVAEGQQGE